MTLRNLSWTGRFETVLPTFIVFYSCGWLQSSIWFPKKIALILLICSIQWNSMDSIQWIPFHKLSSFHPFISSIRQQIASQLKASANFKLVTFELIVSFHTSARWRANGAVHITSLVNETNSVNSDVFEQRGTDFLLESVLGSTEHTKVSGRCQQHLRSSKSLSLSTTLCIVFANECSPSTAHRCSVRN